MTIKDKAAVVGCGSTEIYRRGQSVPRTTTEMACSAILAALDDAGLTIKDLDGFALYSGGMDTGLIAQTLGMDDVRFSAVMSGGGGAAVGSVGLAAAAIAGGLAEVVVSFMSLQQAGKRLGIAFARDENATGSISAYANPVTPENDFSGPSGAVAPGQLFALLARRHMHLYGTKREHMAEIAISSRENASRRPQSMMRTPLTLDDYFNARLIADPLCLYDFCQENDGCVAVVTTSAERARDLRHPPAYVLAAEHGGAARWGQGMSWLNMPDEYFASSGHRAVAKRLYASAGIGPSEVDVAELYDHFTPMVLMQLEDYGFCGIGESGPFVAEGNIRYHGGSLPINTHGGNLSDAYIIGMTHIVEAVEQLRGTAINQVANAEIALVTGGPAQVPVSGLLLRR